jgi:hypothetical protein
MKILHLKTVLVWPSILFLLLMALSLNLNAKLGDRKKKGKGTYDEQLNRQFPYTFFVPNNNTAAFIDEVKLNLQTNDNIKYLLSFVFERYNASYPSFNKKETYQKSMKAKAAAFIYMIGLKFYLQLRKFKLNLIEQNN